MDKYEFMILITDIFEGLKSDEQIDKRKEEMINIINRSAKMAKEYIKAGID
jgi:hypothetical protein